VILQMKNERCSRRLIALMADAPAFRSPASGFDPSQFEPS